jgi:methionyl-tRNA formyltransferase
MRIAFLTNKTAVVSMPVFEQLVCGDEVVLAHTFFYDTISVGRSSPLAILSQFGLRRIASKVLEALASNLRRRLGKRLRTKWLRAKSPFELAVINDLPHSTITDMNAPETNAFLRGLNVDVVLVCVCKNILSRELLSMPNVKFVNTHASLLPRYRGPTPTFWMLYHGEQQTGVTFHLMTPRIDDGMILAQRSMPLNQRLSEFQIEQEVFRLAATLVYDVLRDLGTGQLQGASKSPRSESSYHTFPTSIQRRELKRNLARRR